MPKIAIVAAIEREVWPLVKTWRSTKTDHEGREFTFYESGYAVAVCSGIGSDYARRGAEAIIARYSPELLISAGIAGALVPELRVGDTVFPTVVIDARDASRHETSIRDAALSNSPLARTVLVSSPEVAGAAQKRQLAKSYGAHLVDGIVKGLKVPDWPADGWQALQRLAFSLCQECVAPAPAARSRG